MRTGRQGKTLALKLPKVAPGVARMPTVPNALANTVSLAETINVLFQYSLSDEPTASKSNVPEPGAAKIFEAKSVQVPPTLR